MKDTIKWSHSKLEMLLHCPMTYYLNYVQGITVKKKKPALEIGSAVHYGIEKNTYDLRQYYQDNDMLGAHFTTDQLLAQAMDFFYLTYKDSIYSHILRKADGTNLKLLNEYHEGFMFSKLDSYIPDLEPHNFLGIVDLLLKTDEGLIIIDFKTSTYEPNWDEYLDQLYRYVWLVQKKYPNEKILKIGIVNIRKASIYMMKADTDQTYFTRLCNEYIQNKDKYIDYHEYPADSLDQEKMSDYINNLRRMVDTAYTIDSNKAWYINYAEAVGKYGKSDYWDMFYKTKNAYKKYQIKDTVWSEEKNDFVKVRDCIPLDMEVIENNNVLNHYNDYVKVLKQTATVDKQNVNEACNKLYKTDDSLLDLYWLTYTKKLEMKEKENIEEN